MVESGVEVVRSDGVDSQLLHECRIAQTDSAIAQWILSIVVVVCLTASRLVIDSDNLPLFQPKCSYSKDVFLAHHKTLSSRRINQFLLFDGDSIEGADDRGSGKGRGEESSNLAAVSNRAL